MAVWYYVLIQDYYGSLYIHVPTISMCSFPSDLIMVVQVVSSSSSCLVRSSTPTMVCLSTLPTTPTLFRSAPPPRSSITTWSGLDLLVGSLVWSSLKDSYWMCFSQGLSINHYSASEYAQVLFSRCVPFLLVPNIGLASMWGKYCLHNARIITA